MVTFMVITNTKEQLLYHLQWLMDMANKQFPNGLLEKEIQSTYEIMYLIKNFPDSKYGVPQRKIGNIDDFKQYIRRLQGNE